MYFYEALLKQLRGKRCNCIEIVIVDIYCDACFLSTLLPMATRLFSCEVSFRLFARKTCCSKETEHHSVAIVCPQGTTFDTEVPGAFLLVY